MPSPIRRRARHRGVLLAAICWLLTGSAAVHAQGCALPHPGPASVYLVQNSGWMEPFYTDPGSQFRPLVEALIATTAGSDDVVVADFNQNGQLPGRGSPKAWYCGGSDPSRIDAAVEAIDLPRQPGGNFTDADFDGALVSAIDGILAGHSGIIWLITNNKNSPSNSQQVSDNTRAFAARLGNTAALPTIVAYPLRMAVKGRQYSETGLIIYGIAYGAQAAARLDQLTHSPGLRRLFPDQAVRLKPLVEAPLVFTPTGTSTAGAHVSLTGGTLVVTGVPGGRSTLLEINADLASNYYPQVIDRAAVQVFWRDLSGLPVADAVEGSVEPAELHRLAPSDVLQGVRIHLRVPDIPRHAGIAGLFQNDIVLSGVIAIRLSDMTLTLQDAFQRKMTSITALDQLPSVFFNYRNVTGAETDIPVRLVVRFSSWPLILALGAVVLALLALLALLFLLRREREQPVMIGGQTRRLRLRPFETRQVTAANGRRFGVRGSLFGSPRVTDLDPPEAARQATATRPVPSPRKRS